MLAREVLRLRGTISRQSWDVVVDLFFYRDPEEAEKQLEEAQAAGETTEAPASYQAPPAADYAAPEPAAADWGTSAAAPAPVADASMEWGAAPAPSGAHLSMLVLPRLPGGNRRISVRECKGL